jgi:hypothetical protein
MIKSRTVGTGESSCSTQRHLFTQRHNATLGVPPEFPIMPNSGDCKPGRQFCILWPATFERPLRPVVHSEFNKAASDAMVRNRSVEVDA